VHRYVDFRALTFLYCTSEPNSGASKMLWSSAITRGHSKCVAIPSPALHVVGACAAATVAAASVTVVFWRLAYLDVKSADSQDRCSLVATVDGKEFVIGSIPCCSRFPAAVVQLVEKWGPLGDVLDARCVRVSEGWSALDCIDGWAGWNEKLRRSRQYLTGTGAACAQGTQTSVVCGLLSGRVDAAASWWKRTELTSSS